MSGLTAYYLSLKRLAEILPSAVFYGASASTCVSDLSNRGMYALQVIVSLQTATYRWLAHAKPPSLGEIIATRALRAGTLFTHYGPFIGRGISSAATRFQQGQLFKQKPELRADLDNFLSGARLTIQVHPENYTAASVPGEMSGRHRLFVLGRLTDASPPELRAQAYAIGYLHDDEDHDETVGGPDDWFARWDFHMEVWPFQIDTFAQAAECAPATARQLAKLEEISEEDIKRAFAEIVGEWA